jgi:hypothetical protein
MVALFSLPVFENLILHDCFIEDVSEKGCIWETKSPGMEFKYVVTIILLEIH